MTTQEKLVAKAQEVMKLAAQAMADRGAKQYTAQIHAACMGKAFNAAAKLKEAEATGDELAVLNAEEYAALSHALYNHSAYRQKWEKLGIYSTAEKRPSGLSDLLAQLEEEGV